MRASSRRLPRPRRLFRRRRLVATSALGLLATSTGVVLTATTATAGSTTPAHPSTPLSSVSSVSPLSSASSTVSDLPISFTVRNVNRSAVACASDGRTYTVRGHLVGPSRTLAQRRAPLATLYLHGLSFGEFFWHFQGAHGYDYATNVAAESGQVSAVIDRIGYGGSDKPDGNQVCVGSRADMAHQMVKALRQGTYRVEGVGVRHHGPRFPSVVLAGHSYGGQIAQVEAYSFGDIDGLVVLGYADRVQSEALKQAAAYTAGVCATGGLPVAAGGPGGYAPFGPPSGAPAALFNSATTSVKNAALQRLTLDPCGDTASFPAATAVDLQQVASITIPVLVVAGAADALFPKPAATDQASLFTGSNDVRSRTLARTAHAFTFERHPDRLARIVGTWLGRLNRH